MNDNLPPWGIRQHPLDHLPGRIVFHGGRIYVGVKEEQLRAFLASGLQDLSALDGVCCAESIEELMAADAALHDA